MNPSRIRRHILFLASIVLVAIGLRASLKEHFAHERRQILDNARQLWVDRMQAAWQGLRYTDTAEEAFIEVFLSKIAWNELELSAPQQARLESRLEEVLLYLREPQFEDYYRLKTDGLVFSFEPGEEAMELLASHRAFKAVVGPGEAEELTRVLFEAVQTESGPPGIRAVCLDGIGTTLSRTNTPAALLGGPVARGFTRAQAALNPGFQYRSGSSGKDGSAGVFFHLSFFARATGSDNVGPVYLSLAWLEEDEQWALSRLITQATLEMQTLF